MQNSFFSYTAPSFQGGITKLPLHIKMSNKDIPKNIKAEIISQCNNKEQRAVADKFLSDENLYNNKNIQENIGAIINNCKKPENAQVKLDLINKYLSDEKFYNNKNLQKIIGDIIDSCTTSAKINVTDKYISNFIKETLNLSDEEYINFIENNQNKSFLEMEPVKEKE